MAVYVGKKSSGVRRLHVQLKQWKAVWQSKILIICQVIIGITGNLWFMGSALVKRSNKQKVEVQTCAYCACAVHMQMQATHSMCSKRLTNKKVISLERV